VMGEWKPLVSFGLLLAFWIITSILVNLKHRLQNSGDGGLFAKLAKQSRSYYGMHFAHLGVAIFIIGVTMVNGYEIEKDVRMNVGDVVTVNNYTFRFNGVGDVVGPNYKSIQGEIEVLKDGEYMRSLQPEKRTYNASGMVMTEASIDTGLMRDLYVALGEPLANDEWVVRIYHKPFVTWIWLGCLMMAVCGILAITDSRYRFSIRRKGKAADDDSGNKESEKAADAQSAPVSVATATPHTSTVLMAETEVKKV